MGNPSESESMPTLSGKELTAAPPAWPRKARIPALRFAVRRFYLSADLFRLHSVYEEYEKPVTIQSGLFTLNLSAIKVQVNGTPYNYNPSETLMCLMLEVQCSHTSSADLEQINTTAELMLDEAASKFNRLADMIEAQVYIDIQLPHRILEPIYQPLQRKNLLKHSSLTDLPTASFTTTRLHLGPENIDSIKSVVQFMQTTRKATPSLDVLDSRRYGWTRLLPLIMGSLIVLTWLVPLTSLWINVFCVAFAALVCVIFAPFFARKVNFADMFRRERTYSALFFFAIAIFATCYAYSNLQEPHTLGNGTTTSLGYAYLIATGITFTAGVLSGSLSGFALIIAHVQMIVFTTSLVTAIVALLQVRTAGPRQY